MPKLPFQIDDPFRIGASTGAFFLLFMAKAVLVGKLVSNLDARRRLR